MTSTCDGRARRGLRLLPGIACLLLAGAPAAAQTAIETRHYQAAIPLVCDSVVCTGAFERPGRKRRLQVTRLSCGFVGTPGTPFRYGRVELRQADGGHLLYQYLPPGGSGANGLHAINQAVALQVRANQQLVVELALAGGKAISGSCTASGTLDRLP